MEVDENETRKVTIPLKISAGEAIEVYYNALPSGQDGLNILRSEHPKLMKWIELGVGLIDLYTKPINISVGLLSNGIFRGIRWYSRSLGC